MDSPILSFSYKWLCARLVRRGFSWNTSDFTRAKKQGQEGLTNRSNSVIIPNSVQKSAMTQPRARRFLRTKQTILDAALEIVRTEGPAGLSMRALAERSDYSAAGIYEYFSNKDEIIQAVCEQGHERLASHMRQADPGLPILGYLLGIGLGYIRFALENPDHFLLMFTTAPPAATGKDMSAELLKDDTSFGILLGAIRRGIEEGVFKSRPGFGLMEMAYTAWVTVHGMAMLRLTSLRGYPMDFEAADQAGLVNFARGLTQAN